jgi:putative DNA primase/helicase
MTKPDPFAPIGGDGDDSSRKGRAWTIIMPVPADAPPPPAEHFKLGKPTARWTYTDATGALVGYVLRFDTAAGEKQFRPMTWWRSASGTLEWRWESWPTKRPLYGLERLAQRPTAPIVICEGEKSADAVTQLFQALLPSRRRTAARAPARRTGLRSKAAV